MCFSCENCHVSMKDELVRKVPFQQASSRKFSPFENIHNIITQSLLLLSEQRRFKSDNRDGSKI